MYEKEKEILKNKESFNIEDLKLIVKILRAPGGCPWDAEQTHKSIIPGMIEETYEVVEAIEEESADMLKEELGDVLLQLVFHAEIESENGVFAFDDAVTDVCNAGPFRAGVRAVHPMLRIVFSHPILIHPPSPSNQIDP
jgi:uncharacterized protein YabN with tetrapyrrole methylase and pyrophosphatase domain